MSTIRPKDRDSVIQSLRAGVVPRSGQHLIQVGRVREIETLVKDIERVADGGSSFRLVIGDYGAGKTFFQNLVRAVGMEMKLVVTSADLNPDRRLHASGGQARSLYAELMRNISTRTKPEGGALAGIVEKFISTAKAESKTADVSTEVVIRQKLEQLTELVNGYDFADVIAAYYRGVEEGNEQLKSDAVRWLRGEFSTKTDAKQALGVRSIVDDAAFYDQLKLMARFVRLAGYSGLLICLDELVNLYKLANTQARNANYEQILRILNDSLQGNRPRPAMWLRTCSKCSAAPTISCSQTHVERSSGIALHENLELTARRLGFHQSRGGAVARPHELGSQAHVPKRCRQANARHSPPQ